MADEKIQQPRDYGGSPIPALKPVPGSTVGVAGGSASPVLTSGGVVRLLTADTGMRVRIGLAAVASSDDMQLAAGVPEYFSVYKNEVVAVLGTGAVEVTEMF